MPRTVAMPTQTTANFTRNGTRRLACASDSRTPRTMSMPGAAGPASGSSGGPVRGDFTLRLDSQVLPVPLHRHGGQRPVVVHVLDDLADLLHQAVRVERRALVDGCREGLEEERLTEELDGLAVL